MSPGEYEAVALISEQGFHAEIFSATRSVTSDIDAAIDAGVDGVNIIIPTSKLHIQKKLAMTQEEILEITTQVVQHAKNRGAIAEVCCEDGSRTDMNFLKKVISRAVEAKVDRVTPCDTVGTFTPEQSWKFYNEVQKNFPELDVGVHCHNDFGLATSNTISAIASGVKHVHATINGLGERAGNASLEEIAVALEVLYEVKTGINLQRITDTSLIVSKATGMHVQPNKAIVGKNAFAHESGIHTHAILRDPSTYERIDPSLVGAARRIVSGKHAGGTGLSMSLREMALKPNKDQFDLIFQKVKELGDSGVILSDTDVYEIATDVMGIEPVKPVILEEFIVTTGNKITPTASIKLKRNGEQMMEAAIGNGPVDSTINALVKAIKPEQAIALELYQVEAITGGTNAVVNVEVRLRQGDKLVTSRGTNEDIVMASVDAFLKGVNLYHSIEEERNE